MTDAPWLGDACSLVEAFRSGERSPVEELEATLAAIEASDLGAFVWLDEEGARARAAAADTSLPFGGVPVGVKALEQVAGQSVGPPVELPPRDAAGALHLRIGVGEAISDALPQLCEVPTGHTGDPPSHVVRRV